MYKAGLILDKYISEDQIAVPLNEFYKLADELHQAKSPKVQYNEDTLEMAHATIRQMQYHIEMALQRLHIASKEHTRI